MDRNPGFPHFAAYIMRYTDLNASGVMNFGTHFYPTLAQSSDYVGALKGMMDCVENNKGLNDPVEQGKVCAKEFKSLRLSAFNCPQVIANVFVEKCSLRGIQED